MIWGVTPAASNGEIAVLKLLILLIVIALVAGALGFSGIAAGAAFFAKIIFAIMLIGIAILVGMVLLGIAAFN